MITGDFHTHTTYCDGANSAEEMLLAAIQKGLKVYGFSSHSHLKYDESWNMNSKEQEKYIEEVLSLKEKYKDKIEVLLGCEYDLLSDNDLSRFDYVIGSCHSIIKNGIYLSVDHSEKTFNECVTNAYGGDYYGFVKDYYELLSTASDKKEITFIGHFDLISKFNTDYKYFCEDDPRYEKPMFTALQKLAASGKPMELNTKLSFGNPLKKCIPSTVKWLSEFKKCDGKIIINSDAHSTSRIGDGFIEAKQQLKQIGYNSSFILTGQGIKEISL